MNYALLVLAAGMGSRYGGLKQVDGIGPNQETLLEYSVHDAIKAGFTKVVFVIQESFSEAFMQKMNDKFGRIVELEYVFQDLNNLPKGETVPEGRTKPWGTGHAILSAKDAINEPFVVINADDYYGPKSYSLIMEQLVSTDTHSHDYAMVGFELAKTLSPHGSVSRGVCEIENGMLSCTVERTKITQTENGVEFIEEDGGAVPLSGTETVSMNFWGFTPTIFSHLEKQFEEFLQSNKDQLKGEFYIPTVVTNLIESGVSKVNVIRNDDQWCGLTYADDRVEVEKHISSLINLGIYPTPLVSH